MFTVDTKFNKRNNRSDPVDVSVTGTIKLPMGVQVWGAVSNEKALCVL